MKFFRIPITLLCTLLTSFSQENQESPGWPVSATLSPDEAAQILATQNPEETADFTRASVESTNAHTRGVEASAANTIEDKSLQSAVIGVSNPPSPVIAGNAADAITPEIAELARGLQYDPLLIFSFVRNRIDYEVYFGSRKGAHMTLMDMSGNDYDQAALLVSLLRASGYSPTYKAGPLAFAYADYEKWIGITNPFGYLTDTQFAALIGTTATNPDLPNLRKAAGLLTFLNGRGFPMVQRIGSGSGLGFGIPMVWVQVSVDGATRDLLPAFKTYDWTTGIDFATATGFSKSQFLSDIGGTVPSTNSDMWVSGMSSTTISSRLTTFTNNLRNFIRTNHDSDYVSDILPSKHLIQQSYTSWSQLPSVFPYNPDWASYESWTGTAIPEDRMSKIAITAGVYNSGTATFTSTLYTQTLNMPALAGGKLSLGFNGNTATFRMDEATLGSAFTLTAASTSVKLEATHPHYSWQYVSAGNYTKTAARDTMSSVDLYLKNDSYSYVFPYAFSGSQKQLRARQEILDAYRRSGLTDSDWRVRTETLNIIGLSYYYQLWKERLINGGLFSVDPLAYQFFGRVVQENYYYIDVNCTYSSMMSRSINYDQERACFVFSSLYMSAMEHGVIEQMQPKGTRAASTLKMVQIANDAGDRIYRATPSNWSTVNSQLLNYTSAVKTLISAGLTNGGANDGVALVPRNGDRLLDQWHGYGYAMVQPLLVQMKISGGLNGGYSSTTGSTSSDSLAQGLSFDPAILLTLGGVTPVPYDPVTAPQPVSFDPIDLLSGAFLLNKNDLVLGNAPPKGLGFSRHYHSHLRYNDASGLGYGWTHGSDIRLSERSSTRAALGETNAYQAVASLASAYVASQLYSGSTTAKEWAAAALVTNWGVEQMKYNAVAITLGTTTVEFAKQPDGTFVPPPGTHFTLTQNGSGLYVMNERNGNTFNFNSSGRIATIVDPNGNTETFTYNGSGQLTTIKDAYNRTLTFTWTNGRISSISDGTGRSVAFTYNSGNLSTFTDAEGKAWTYQYDGEHCMTSLKDPDGRTIAENDYDSNGRVIRQRSMGDAQKQWHYAYSGFRNVEINPQGETKLYFYDERGRNTDIVDPLGNISTSFFDAQDRIWATMTPKGEVTYTSWNTDHNAVSATDPLFESIFLFYDSQKRLQIMSDKRGKDTSFTYSAAHQLQTSTDPLGHVGTNTYYADGNLHTVKDAENKITTYGYDSWGKVNKITYNDGTFRSFTNNARGDVLESKDGEGRTTTFTYDKRRLLLTTTLPSVPGEPAAVVVNTYDNAGNLLTTTDARGNVSTFTHNALEKLVSVTQPSLPAGNNVLTRSYDSRDWLAAITDSLGNATSMDYDSAQRVTAVTDALNRRMETVYDANGQTIQFKDPLNRVRQQVWNARGEKEREIDAANKNSDFVFDENGNRKGFVNRRGKSYQAVFDDANRSTSTTTPGGKTTSVTYFDNDLVKTIQEPSAEITTLGYNGRNLVQSRTDAVGTIGYQYDNSNLLQTITEGGAVITRTYDERGRLKTFTNADGDLIQYKYDATGNLTRLTYPDGKLVDYAYNSRNLLESVTDWAGRITTYQYDRLGRLMGVIRPNGTSASFSRDAVGQLISVRESANGSLFSYLSFSHDEAGQISSRFRAPLVNAAWQHPSITATYDDDNRLLTVNGSAVVHDADGNMTQGPISSTSGSLTLVYNARNQLTSADGVSYTYDAEGRRRTSTGSVGTTRYTINPDGRLLVKHAPDSSKIYYVYGLGLLYEADEAGQTKTYHFDQVGSTIVRTNDVGAVIGRAEYSAYGLVSWQTGDMSTPFLYNGQTGVTTETNGLLNMRARYYSPYLMRFLNADPSGFSGGSNWFAYANGNPISLSDPFGLCAEDGGGFWDSVTRSIAKFVEDNAEMDARSDRYNAWLDQQDARTQFAYRWGSMAVDPEWIMDPSEHKIEMMVWGTLAIASDGLLRRVPMTRGPSPWLAAESTEEMVTVYRGVHGSHPDVEAAYRGQANPRGGHSDPVRHNEFDNESVFTSWTTDKNVAIDHATQWGSSGGVILEQTVPRSSLVPSPDLLMESEVLRVGPTSGASTTILTK